MRSRWLRGLVSLGVGVALPAAAAPGEHVPVGDALLTPKVGVGAEYSNNVWHAATVDEDSGAADMKLAPELELKLDRKDLLASAKGTYELHKYFGPHASALDRFDDFSLTGQVDALRESMLGFRGDEGLGLVNSPVDAESSDHSYTKNFRNQTRASAVVRPGAAIELVAGGRYAFDDFSTARSDGGDLGHYNSRHTIGPAASASWRFLPRTVLAIDFSYDFASYTSPLVEVADAPDRVFSNHQMMRLTGGIRGQITERLALTAMAGYGAATYQDTTQVVLENIAAGVDLSGADHLLLDTWLRYNLTEDDALLIGYERSFRDSFFTNFVAFDKGHVSTDLKFAERFGLVAEASVAAERYRGQETRDDVLLGLKADATYNLRDWAAIGAGARWDHRISSNADVQYDEVAAGLSATFTY